MNNDYLYYLFDYEVVVFDGEWLYEKQNNFKKANLKMAVTSKNRRLDCKYIINIVIN
jgi:hypothetical protein